MSDVGEILWFGPPRYPLSEVVARLTARLRGRVERAYVFGSYARGEANDESDVDVLVVCSSTRPPPERGKDFLDMYRDFDALDLIVYTPEEWRQMERDPTSLVARERESWKVVIEPGALS